MGGIDPAAKCWACDQPVGEFGFEVRFGSAPVGSVCSTCVSSGREIGVAFQAAARRVLSWARDRRASKAAEKEAG